MPHVSSSVARKIPLQCIENDALRTIPVRWNPKATGCKVRSPRIRLVRRRRYVLSHISIRRVSSQRLLDMTLRWTKCLASVRVLRVRHPCNVSRTTRYEPSPCVGILTRPKIRGAPEDGVAERATENSRGCPFASVWPVRGGRGGASFHQENPVTCRSY
jgi:hypothetical protein